MKDNNHGQNKQQNATEKTSDIRTQLTKEVGSIQNLDGIFTIAFHGYKKEAVKQYINALVESTQAEKESLQETNRQLTEKVASLQDEIQEEILRYNELYNSTRKNVNTEDGIEILEQEDASDAEDRKAVEETIEEERQKLIRQFEEKEAKLKADLDREKEEIRAEYEAKQAEENQREALEKEALNQRITDLENARQAENKKYKVLKEEYAAYSKKQEKTLADNIASLRNTENLWDMEKQSASKLREQIAALRKELDDGKMAQLKNKIQDLDGKLSAAAEREKLQTEALASMTLQKKRAEEKIADLRETLSAAEAKNDTLHLACIKAESYKETLEAEVTKIYREMLALKAEKTVSEAENN